MLRVSRLALITGVVIVVAVLWAGLRRILPSSVDYRGEKVKLTKFYLDYDDYKNDPDNIDPSETGRVQRLVSKAPIARAFADRRAAVNAVFDIKFPGYGAGGFGGELQKNEGSLNGLVIEIPRSDNSRYFIFRVVNGGYILVDDFIASGSLDLRTVHDENGSLVYYNASGMPALTHAPLRSDQSHP